MRRKRHSDKRLRFTAGCLIPALVFLCCLPSEAQVFGEGGLFNRKKNQQGPSKDEIGVPVPQSGRVEALRGHEVTFEIGAESKTPGATVEFLVRTFPSAGKIVSLVSKPNERNKAIVTYYADPNSSATSDAFAFAAKYRDGRYSSAVRYDIDLVDHKADIVVSESVDFGEVMMGDEAIRDVAVANTGDAPFSRQLHVAAPWHIIDPPGGNLLISPNGRRNVKIAFRPQLGGETTHFLSFSRSRRGMTRLEGTGVPSFSVKTKEVELAINEETRRRSGEIVLTNHSEKAIRIAASASSRLQRGLNEAYLLAPGQDTAVRVALAENDMAPFDGMVQFTLGGGYTLSASVVAKVVPGWLEVTMPDSISSEVINFGKVEAGRSTERQFVLTNPGGVAVPLEFHVPEPFRLLTNPGPRLGALSEVNLSIGLYPPSNRKGMVDATMHVFSNDEAIPIRLLGNVIRPEGAVGNDAPTLQANPLDGLRLNSGVGSERPDPEPMVEQEVVDLDRLIPSNDAVITLDLSSDTAGAWLNELDEDERDAITTPSGTVAIPTIARDFDQSIRKPEDLSVIETGSRSVVIGWTAPRDSENMGFDVEVIARSVVSGGSPPVALWIPYSDVEFKRVDRLVRARISGLSPVTKYEFRVFTVDIDEQCSIQSQVLSVETELPMDWTYIYLFCGIGLVVALGLGVIHVVKARQPEVYQSKYADL